MIRHFITDDVLNVQVYGREGLAEAKAAISAMLSEKGNSIREVIVKVHFARPQDVNGGDKLMSCMFAHSLVRLIAIVTQDEGQIDHVNRAGRMLTCHGIQARAFSSISDLADWVERELPEDALACGV